MNNGNQRIAVVIGGASGIGWATAQALAAEAPGHRRRPQRRRRRSRADELGDPHTAACGRRHRRGSVKALFDQTGPVDVVVNCAGISNFGLITEMAVDEFRDVVDVCLTGAFIVAKHAGQQPARRRRAGVDLLAERAPTRGRDERLLRGQGRTVDAHPGGRAGVGPRGIRVNAVAPGFVAHAAHRRAAAGPGVVEDYVENTALGRAGTPEDIADAVVFLCSPRPPG